MPGDAWARAGSAHQDSASRHDRRFAAIDPGLAVPDADEVGVADGVGVGDEGGGLPVGQSMTLQSVGDGGGGGAEVGGAEVVGGALVGALVSEGVSVSVGVWVGFGLLVAGGGVGPCPSSGASPSTYAGGGNSSTSRPSIARVITAVQVFAG